MSSDTTFITNEGENNLKDRFRILLTGTRFFDVLVGYFFTSGFYTLLKSVEKTEKIRILIGIGTNKDTIEVIEDSKQLELFELSHAEAKQKLGDTVVHEMEVSEDNSKIEEGASRLVEWIQRGKVKIKAYPSGNIHAKLYIITFPEGDKDKGRVITGSSNLTLAGLSENLEFNVELKNRSDYEFALTKFNELWESSVDVSEKYVETITKRTWLSKVDPYELYLKLLYEYFKEKINRDKESIEKAYLPENFLDLEYQSEAVKDAKGKLDEILKTKKTAVHVGLLLKNQIDISLLNQLDNLAEANKKSASFWPIPAILASKIEFSEP